MLYGHNQRVFRAGSPICRLTRRLGFELTSRVEVKITRLELFGARRSVEGKRSSTTATSTCSCRQSGGCGSTQLTAWHWLSPLLTVVPCLVLVWHLACRPKVSVLSFAVCPMGWVLKENVYLMIN